MCNLSLLIYTKLLNINFGSSDSIQIVFNAFTFFQILRFQLMFYNSKELLFGVTVNIQGLWYGQVYLFYDPF